MMPLPGSVKKGFGRQKKLNNGLRFSQRIKRDWYLSLLLLPSLSGNEFALLKVLCKPLQLSNISLFVIPSLLKLAIWTSSFLAWIQKFHRLVAFLRNLLMMFHRVSSKAIRLLMNMRRFKGLQPGSVFKALIFPKLPIHLFLLRLIPSLEKLIVFGAWGVVPTVLNLITLGVIVPPPHGVQRVLRRVTNLNFVKPEVGQGFFGGPRCEITSPAQQLKRRV
jgi:hypothetical protein